MSLVLLFDLTLKISDLLEVAGFNFFVHLLLLSFKILVLFSQSLSSSVKLLDFFSELGDLGGVIRFQQLGLKFKFVVLAAQLFEFLVPLLSGHLIIFIQLLELLLMDLLNLSQLLTINLVTFVSRSFKGSQDLIIALLSFIQLGLVFRDLEVNEFELLLQNSIFLFKSGLGILELFFLLLETVLEGISLLRQLLNLVFIVALDAIEFFTLLHTIALKIALHTLDLVLVFADEMISVGGVLKGLIHQVLDVFILLSDEILLLIDPFNKTFDSFVKTLDSFFISGA
mmetsp:Transcript_5340/g.4524  ORF Transcript_5340/g.4524 Transcript_5340/m.4524 type:complete len:284 (+) Transcript_5340:2215-3066(+)